MNGMWHILLKVWHVAHTAQGTAEQAQALCIWVYHMEHVAPPQSSMELRTLCWFFLISHPTSNSPPPSPPGAGLRGAEAGGAGMAGQAHQCCVKGQGCTQRGEGCCPRGTGCCLWPFLCTLPLVITKGLSLLTERSSPTLPYVSPPPQLRVQRGPLGVLGCFGLRVCVQQ